MLVLQLVRLPLQLVVRYLLTFVVASSHSLVQWGLSCPWLKSRLCIPRPQANTTG